MVHEKSPKSRCSDLFKAKVYAIELLAARWDHKEGPKITNPEGPSTQYLRTLIPNTIKGIVFRTRVLKDWVLGASGESNCEPSPGAFFADAVKGIGERAHIVAL